MQVNIKYSSWYKKFVGDKESIYIELPDLTTAIEAVVKVGIPREQVGFIVVNNVKVANDCVLNEGDNIKVFPSIIGG